MTSSEVPMEDPKPKVEFRPTRGPIPFPAQPPQNRVAADDLREALKKPPIEVEE